LRLLPVTEPVLRPQAEPSRLLPLAAIRPDFDAGAVLVIFLALGGLPAAPAGILTVDEEARARRLVAPPVKRGFIAGRWLLRSALAALTGAEPQSLELRAAAHGKLFLTGHERSGPCFNLTHSGDLAAVALVRDRRVGIDIEAARALTDRALLARRILGARERTWFETLPESAREAALLAAWTRKEAVLKAMGTGISDGLRSVEMPPDDSEQAVVHEAEPSVAWSVSQLPVPPGYYGTIALEREARRLTIWQAQPAVGP
jgi:4'-phosphopantetheinyl transferase